MGYLDEFIRFSRSPELLALKLFQIDEPHYDQLPDWVRAQPIGAKLLAIFGQEEAVPSVFDIGITNGGACTESYGSAWIRNDPGEYQSIWLSRHVSIECEAKIPRGVKVYREK